MVTDDPIWAEIAEWLVDISMAGQTPVCITLGRSQLEWARGLLKLQGARRGGQIHVANLPVLVADEDDCIEIEVLASLESFLAIERAFQKSASRC